MHSIHLNTFTTFDTSIQRIWMNVAMYSSCLLTQSFLNGTNVVKLTSLEMLAKLLEITASRAALKLPSTIEVRKL